VAPLILGLVLGDLLDKNLLRGLTLTAGDVSPFFTRPVSAVLCAVTLGSVLLSVPAVRARAARLLRR
jgi:putative tricarboxylic transport membrane protein